MTTIPSTSGTTPDPRTQLSSAKNAQMQKDDFLKLFVAQLQHQDPMKPMDDAAYMGQLAQYSTLEQTSNMAADLARVATSLGGSSAVALLGRTVTYTGADKAVHTGVVEKVSTPKDGTPSLTVGGLDGVDPSSITQVA